MTREEIKRRFISIREAEYKNNPWKNAETTARKALIEQLKSEGLKNHDAVFEIYKAMREK